MRPNMTRLLAIGALVVAGGTARAQPLPIAGCALAKIKCEVTYLKGRLVCEGKAAKGGLPVDPICTGKVGSKFSGAPTSCMERAEAKFPGGCNATGDAGTEKGKLDAFIASLKAARYVSPAPTGANACVAGQYKCVTTLYSGLLGCDGKGIKTGRPVESACVAKVLGKFANAFGKGCMDKLDAKACTTSGTTGSAPAVLASTLTAIAETGCDQAPSGHTIAQTSQASALSCGYTSGSVDTDLACGDLYIGGGGSTVLPGATPPGSSTIFNVGGALDLLCARTAVETGSNRNCTDVGCFFGAPLPIVDGGASSCVDIVFQQRGGGQVLLATGDVIASLPLQSIVTATGNPGQPCPLCVSGACSADAANPGAPCTADATSLQSHDCIAAGPVLPPFTMTLAPITTGAASKFDASGLLCPSQAHAGALGDPSVVGIFTSGTPVGDLTAGPPTNGVLGSVFCIPATGNALIDGSADLPGPGAITLPISVDLI
jgi:hypothetical protein